MENGDFGKYGGGPVWRAGSINATYRQLSVSEGNCLRLIQEQRDLHTFNDPVVAFRTGAERLKRLLVSLAFVSRQRDVITVKFNDDRPLLQSSFMGLNLACGQGQKASAE